jgi:hypothetical protein
MKTTILLLTALLSTWVTLSAQQLDFYASTPLVKALDANGDQVLSKEECKAAATALLALDKDENGIISDKELGGPGSFPGWTRLQTPVRAIDTDGDFEFTNQEIAAAPARLARLDINGDAKLTRDELADKRVVQMAQGGTGGRRMPPFVQRLPGGMTESMLSQILNNEKVTDVIMPGENKKAWDGYLLFTESNIANDIQLGSTTFLLDTDGKTVHTWTNPRGVPEGAAAYLLDNGLLLRQSAPGDWLVMEEYRVGAHGIVELVDWDGKVVWEYQRATPDRHILHHDLEPLPNGNILVLSYEALTTDQFRAMGWNPEKPRTTRRGADVGVKGSHIWVEKILELKPDLKTGKTEVVWEWDVTKHLVQELDPKKPNYGKIAESLDRIDMNYRAISDALLHFNSIDYHPERNQIMVSSLLNNELYFIDRKSGKIVYRWGNRVVHDPGTREKALIGGQHDARWLDGLPASGGGHLTVHNNHAGTIEGARGRTMFQLGARYSSIIEVMLPAFEKGRYGDEPSKVVWEYLADPPGSWYAPFMSGASRLPNGNTLVVNSHNKRIFEVTARGKKVLDFQFPGVGRMFRVYKIAPDHPAMQRLAIPEKPDTADGQGCINIERK